MLITSLLCFRLRLSRLLFVTSPCVLLKISIGSLSACYITAAVFWASTVASSVLLCQCRAYYLFKVSFVSLSVCYVSALFYASTVSPSVCYVTMLSPHGFHCFIICFYVSLLSLQGFYCFIICLLRHCSVLGFDCLLRCLFRHYRPTISSSRAFLTCSDVQNVE